MDAKQAIALLQRYQEGVATPEEIQLVEQWYQRLADSGEWRWDEGEKEALEAVIRGRLLRNIQEEDAGDEISVPRVHFMRRMKWVAAAAIILSLGVGSYFLVLNKSQTTIAKTQTREKRFKNNSAPDGNKAVLTLANGSTVILDSGHVGVLTKQGNVSIIKLDSGQLAYSISNARPAEVLYNTLTTPRGGQYRLTLADGTQVWLNAASSIKYPIAFAGKEREVEITGEAYFEVAKDHGKPFRVKAADEVVEVLGTHFNIMAYPEEGPVRTTLLEGSVKLNAGDKNKILSPGEQAALGDHSGQFQLSHPDLDEVIAWKNGQFMFSRKNIKAIMRQLARWYDVDVVYQGDLSDVYLSGVVSLRKSPDELLQIFEETGKVHFQSEDGKIIVIQGRGPLK